MIRGREVTLWALVAGLLLGPYALWAAPGPGLMFAVLVLARRLPVSPSRRRPVAVAAMLALAGGAALGHARAAAVAPVAAPSTVRSEAILLSAPEPDRFGGERATVSLDKRTVLLQAGEIPGRIGDVLAVRGELGPPNPVALALRAAGSLRATSVEATGAHRGGLRGFVDGVRARAERALEGGLPATEAGLLRGMVLGQDEALTADLREDFRAAGLSHLTAASGQNVMLLAALAIAVGAIAGIGIRARWWVAMALIALYVPLAGAGPSIQRAGVMGAAGIAALLLGRPRVRWWSLGLAAAVTLALDPRAAEQPGWQMSFAAVVGILVVAPPLRERLDIGRLAGEAVAVTVAATLATAPLIALHFGRTSLVSLPANVLAVAAVAPVMWLGMLAGAVGQVSASLAAPLSALAGVPLGFLVALARFCASAPRAEVAIPWTVVLAACAVAAVCLARAGVERRRPARRLRPLALAAILGAAIVIGVPPAPPGPPGPGVLRLSFLDIGQGDSTLLEAGGAAVLVDAGPPGGPILRRLREAGIRALDLLVVTHGSSDHLGGVPDVLGAMPVGALLDGRDGDRSPVAAAIERGADRVRWLLPRPGMKIRAGPIELDILHPAPGPPAEDPNDRAIVAVASAFRHTVLLPADGESNVLAGLELGDVDVLKVSHHGSADPGLPALLERMTPEVAVIPVGRGNSYGHPAKPTVQALEAVPRVLRTDRDGTVRIEFGPGGAASIVRAGR